MHLAITVRRDGELARVRALIEEVRRVLSAEQLTVLEAPQGLTYTYPFPVVTVSEGSRQVRHFGADAVDCLQNIARR